MCLSLERRESFSALIYEEEAEMEPLLSEIKPLYDQLVLKNDAEPGCLPSQGSQGKVREIHFHQKWVREIREKHGESGKVREKSGKSHACMYIFS